MDKTKIEMIIKFCKFHANKFENLDEMDISQKNVTYQNRFKKQKKEE